MILKSIIVIIRVFFSDLFNIIISFKNNFNKILSK